jgi:hypothetical protein
MRLMLLFSMLVQQLDDIWLGARRTSHGEPDVLDIDFRKYIECARVKKAGVGGFKVNKRKTPRFEEGKCGQ